MPVEVAQVPVVKDEVEDEERDEEEAGVVVYGRPGRPLHREKRSRSPSARGEDEIEDEGRDEHDQENGIHDGVLDSAAQGFLNVRGWNKNAGDGQSLQALVS